MQQYVKVYGQSLEAQLQVLFLKDGDFIVAVCPSLQLSAYGENIPDAKKSFETTLQIFFQDLSKRNALRDELSSLGWAISDHEFFRDAYLNDLIQDNLPLTILQQDREHFQTALA
jgi:hypothetical protein